MSNMACGPCKKQAEDDAKRLAKHKAALMVSPEMMDMRHTACMSCDMQEMGRCRLMPTKELGDFIQWRTSQCPLPTDPRW